MNFVYLVKNCIYNGNKHMSTTSIVLYQAVTNLKSVMAKIA